MACVWLIKRFVDKEANFYYVPWGQEHSRDLKHIAFSIPGVELSPHDSNGTTFLKILRKYEVCDPALEEMALMIQKGVDHVLHGYHPAPQDRLGQMAIGLLAISEGMMLSHLTDDAIAKANTPVYDALYDNFKVHEIVKAKGLQIPRDHSLGPTLPTQFLRQLLKDNS
jgi:hypothetical protein